MDRKQRAFDRNIVAGAAPNVQGHQFYFTFFLQKASHGTFFVTVYFYVLRY